VLLAVAMTVAAAQSSRTFSGTIVDPQGGVLPGVAVTLTSADGRAAETTTNRSGQFQFAGLPGGNYTVRVQIPGFRSYEGPVTVASANVVQTIGLEIGQVQEMINVVDPGKDAGMSEPTVSSASAVPDRGCGAQPAAAPGAVRIGGSIRVPLKLKDVKPVFPANLRGTGASADVVLDAVIGTDGFVHDIRARDVSQPAFVDAFVQAVTQWQFAATLLNCVAIETPITITGHFRSNGGV
jgi:hypothetical protein